jgi:hypothetical protein
MATVKADAHFVDCDIDPQTPVTWDWEFGGNYGAYSLTYASENANIWGLPFTDTTVSSLTKDSVAIDNGDGTVSLPSHGHPFEDGWVIYITNTTGTSYNGTFTIQAGSTGTNYIKITSSYFAYTCTGNERTMRYFSLPSSTGASVQDSDGDVYYGSNETNNTYVTKIEADGTLSYPITQPDWPYAAAYTCIDIAIQGDYIYLWLDWSTTNRVYKFDLTDYSLVWKNPFNNPGNADFDLDSSGNLYAGAMGDDHLFGGVQGSTVYEVGKLDADDGTLTSIPFPRIKTNYETVVDNDLGIIICAGTDAYVDTDPINAPGWNLQTANLDGTNWKGRRFGPISNVIGPSWDTDYTIGKDQVWTYNGFIYVIIQAEGKLYKLNTDLETLATIEVTGLVGGWYDLWNNLVLVSPDQTILFTFCDADTLDVLKTELDQYYSPASPLDNWDSAFVYFRGDAYFWPGIETPSTFVAPGSHQYRTVAYPQDYAHLEGQTVQVLSDGIYLDDDTYTIVGGTESPAVSGTTDHIGLQVVSKLQPMKIDGEVHVKKIRQIIPDVYESVGGEYGKELDDMYTMELRTTNDIMERDNALYSGYVELPYKGQYDRSGDMWFTQDIPLPLTLLGIGVRLSKEDI